MNHDDLGFQADQSHDDLGFVPESTEGKSPDQPISKPLLGDSERMASSYGNDKGNAKTLVGQGYVDAKRNAKGDLVYRNVDGKWYKDADNFFQNEPGAAGYIPDHPINWAEANVGKSLPVMGMIAGGTLGLGYGGLIGAPVGAGLGSTAGEAARQSAGRYFGTYDGDMLDSAKDLGKAGIDGATAEMGGQVFNRLPVGSIPGMDKVVGKNTNAGDLLNNGVESALNLGKKAVAKTSQFLSGAPSEAVERLIERPTQVLGADSPNKALDVAKSARQEFLDRNQIEKDTITGARKTFRDQYGKEIGDTSPIVKDNQDFLINKAPVDGEEGALSQSELENLSSIEKNRLTTKNVISPEVQYSPLTKIQPKFGPSQTQTLYHQLPDPIPSGTFANESKFASLSDLGNELKQRHLRQSAAQLEKANASGFNPYNSDYEVEVSSVEPPELKFGKPEVYSPEVSEQLPKKSAASLQNFADYLKTEIDRFDQSKIPGTGDTAYQARMRRLYGQTKDLLHTMDPNGLGAADARFSQYATDAGRLGKLENEDQMEGFINNFYGKNKSMMRDSASRLIPNNLDDISDLAASRAFEKQGPSGSDMGKRTLYGGLAAAGVVGHGMASHSPTEMALGAGIGLITSPTVHKQVIGRTSQAAQAALGPWFRALQTNPELVQTLSPKLRELVQEYLSSSGSMMPNFASQNQKRDIASDPIVSHEQAKQQMIQNKSN